MMRVMVKGSGGNSSSVEGVVEAEARGRKRDKAADPPEAFVLALADALRDILQDERRRAA